MNVFQQAIEDGVQQGLHEAFAQTIEDLGDCYDEPQDRCVMRPKDGCACLHSRWQRLPWYKRMFTKEPVKPDVKHVMEAAIKLVIEEAAFDARMERKERGL